MRIGAVLVAIGVAAALLIAYFPPGLYLLVPVAVAAFIVAAWRPSPGEAAVQGMLVTGGVCIGLALPVIFVEFLLGDLANDSESCDAFCWNNEEGLLINALLTFVFTVPMAIAGAVVAAIAAAIAGWGSRLVSSRDATG